MSHLNYHPAPGLSDLAPGWFVVPQNPLAMGPSTVLVPTMGATAPGRWLRNPTLADLVQASFAVPQNPIVQNLAGSLAGLRGLGCGCSGGCNGGSNFYGLNGLGQVGTDSVSSFLYNNLGSPGQWLATDATLAGMTIPMWGWLAGAGAALYVAADLFGKGKAASKSYAGRASRRLSQYAGS
jgi:hypothetical protein